MMEKPGGRRYEACTDYHQRIQMGDEVHGYEAEAVSSVNHVFTQTVFSKLSYCLPGLSGCTACQACLTTNESLQYSFLYH